MVRRSLLCSWLLAGCLSAPVERSAGSDCDPVAFSADFDQDGWRDVGWGRSDESAGGELRAEGGRAVIASDGDAGSYGWYGTTSSYDVSGRCLQVDVPVMFVSGEDVATEAYLGVYLGDEWVAVGQSGGDLCCLHERGDTTLSGGCALDYSPEAHARWRLRFDAGAFACDVAPASGAWSEVGRFSYGGPLDGFIELLAGTWDDMGAEPGEVAFDNLNL